MIRLHNISKGYMTQKHGWKQVLDGISVDIPREKSLGILGVNGAGKSTLLRILSGLDLPDKGRLETSGSRISWPLGSAGGIHANLSGRENIKFICRIYQRNIEAVTSFVQEFAELGDYMYMPVNTYSTGMRARLGFGISMALDFDTYLVDEGFSGGDAKFHRKAKLIFAEKAKNSNMIVVSHNAGTIRKFCNSAGILQNGKLTVYDDVEEAIETYDNLW